ncbi:MAG: NAD-dependent epimerase/dehydratase family protein [Flavobacteriia bacterium]|nr:NAD-dependent epimerase/dehydratase family protein [Flavobacteriia bacterium]
MAHPSSVNSLKGKSVLITGGAGFIGSNLVGELLKIGAKVTVLDNLETGNKNNLTEFLNQKNFKFIEGDIKKVEDCYIALDGIELVSHQAALGSVPRSIEFPFNTHDANATGFLNILHACKEKKIKRFVFASSSSVYGDCLTSPKVEGDEGNLLSPYAVTKELNEQYAKVYFRLHNLETIGLRYFNVFGPKQNPNGAYAAAIPKFIDKMIHGEEIMVHGDGNQSRDFTYVKNAVLANLLALSSENKDAFGQTFNVACGESYSINYIIETIRTILESKQKYNKKCTLVYGPERSGDIKHSLANISKIKKTLNYNPLYLFEDGIKEYLS